MAKSKKDDPKKTKSILDSDSDSDTSSSDSEPKEKKKGVTFSINAQYAKQYQSRKQREELIKERRDNEDGIESDSDSSSSSDEDEDADLLTTKLDVDILKTINALRSKDESIYNPNVRFFAGSDEESSEDEESEDEGKKKKKAKPKRVKDVIREQILEQMQEEEEGEDKESAGRDMSRFAYDEQQQELRKAFLDSKKDDSSDSDQEEDEFLVIKKRHAPSENDETKDQLDQELKNLEESVLQKSSTTIDTKHQLVDPRGEVEDGEKFLLKFIKNKTWIDKNEINFGNDDDSDEESLEQLEKSYNFEARYNFRFEEAQAESTSGADRSVQGYARSQTMNTLRRKDEKRRDKRLARKERKAAERKAKEEKLRRLKNAKREEIEQKMKQVKAVLGANNNDDAAAAAAAGNNSETLEGLKDTPIDEAAIMKLLEGDFDPDKFEKSMQEAFGDDFYQKEDEEWKTDEDVKEALKKDGEVDFVDDVEEEDETGPQEQPAEALVENDETYDEEEHYDGNDDGDMDEEETELEQKLRAKMTDKLYELDYEDIVGGMPTRFKYREVEANNYGLSTEEILLARDQTLKQFVSLKQMAPYREGEEYHVSSRKRRKFREMLQQDVDDAEKRLKEQGITVNDNHEHDNNDESEAPRKKKRRRMKKGGTKDNESKAVTGKRVESEENDQQINGTIEGAEETTDGKKSKRRRKKKGKKMSNASTKEDDNKEKSEKPIVSLAADSEAMETKAKESDKPTQPSESKKSQKKKKKKKKKVEGVSSARLASYDL